MKISIHALALVGFAQFLFLTVPAHPYGRQEGRVRDVRGFKIISFETAGRLILVQGDKEYLTIDAPADTIRRIITKVDGDTLHIRYRGMFTGRNAVPIFTLGVKNVRALIASSAGDIEAERIDSEALDLDASSSGEIVVGSLAARDLRVRIRSSGSIAIGSGAVATLDARMTSSGGLRIKGNAKDLKLEVSSSGDVQGDDFKVASAAVSLSSSGDAVLWVTDRLEANLEGKGKLAYWGKPRLGGGAASGASTLVSLGAK